MKYSVEISVEAENDIEAIYRYIAFNLCSPDHAAGQVDRLYKMIFSLDEMPFRFRRFLQRIKARMNCVSFLSINTAFSILSTK